MGQFESFWSAFSLTMQGVKVDFYPYDSPPIRLRTKINLIDTDLDGSQQLLDQIKTEVLNVEAAYSLNAYYRFIEGCLYLLGGDTIWDYVQVFERLYAPNQPNYVPTVDEIGILLEDGTIDQWYEKALRQSYLRVPDKEDYRAFVDKNAQFVRAHHRWQYEQRDQARVGYLARQYPNFYPGEVYLLKAPTGYYKIGHSKHFHKRAPRVIYASPFALQVIHRFPTNHIFCAEDELSMLLAHKRVWENGAKSAWFDLTPEDVAKIMTIRERRYPWLEIPVRTP